MPNYSKSGQTLNAAEGQPARLTLEFQLDANNELPTTASAVRTKFFVSVDGRKFETVPDAKLSDFGLSGSDLSSLRAVVDKIKDNAFTSKFGFTKS